MSRIERQCFPVYYEVAGGVVLPEVAGGVTAGMLMPCTVASSAVTAVSIPVKVAASPSLSTVPEEPDWTEATNALIAVIRVEMSDCSLPKSVASCAMVELPVAMSLRISCSS